MQCQDLIQIAAMKSRDLLGSLDHRKEWK
jgi:hypothetical protein